jgi:hypothetical protein
MEAQTRRTFYKALLSWIGSVIGMGLGVPAAAYLFIARESKKQGNFVEAVKLTQLEVSNPQEATFERTRVDGWRTFNEKGIAWVGWCAPLRRRWWRIRHSARIWGARITGRQAKPVCLPVP